MLINAYKNPVVLSRTHEDIEWMIALLVLTQSSYYFMILMVIIRYYNHQNFFRDFADGGAERRSNECTGSRILALDLCDTS